MNQGTVLGTLTRIWAGQQKSVIGFLAGAQDFSHLQGVLTA